MDTIYNRHFVVVTIQVLVTNTVVHDAHEKRCHKIKSIDISLMLAEAIRRIYHGESMSYLFRNIPMEDWQFLCFLVISLFPLAALESSTVLLHLLVLLVPMHIPFSQKSICTNINKAFPHNEYSDYNYMIFCRPIWIRHSLLMLHTVYMICISDWENNCW